MTNVLLLISYDGTDFAGWQRQDKYIEGDDSSKERRTVQGEIEKALFKMLKTHVALHGSGRTDSGVHAIKQAANFLYFKDNIPEKNYARALNGLLPKDIRINGVSFVPESFSARFSATSRIYRYFIQTEKPPLATESRYRWFIPYRPNIETLNKMCSCLKGELDCASFASSGDSSLSTCRYIEKAYFSWSEENPNLLVFQIEANAFLWKMVRTIVGTLIQCERKGLNEEDFRLIIENRDRKKSGLTAPPSGLFLWEVKFDGKRRHI